MSDRLYFDVNVSHRLRRELPYDSLTAQYDGYATASDREILARAEKLGRILVTHDEDFASISIPGGHPGVLLIRPDVQAKAISDALLRWPGGLVVLSRR